MTNYNSVKYSRINNPEQRGWVNGNISCAEKIIKIVVAAMLFVTGLYVGTFQNQCKTPQFVIQNDSSPSSWLNTQKNQSHSNSDLDAITVRPLLSPKVTDNVDNKNIMSSLTRLSTVITMPNCSDMPSFATHIKQLGKNEILGFDISKLFENMSEPQNEYPSVSDAESYLELLQPYVTCMPHKADITENPFKLKDKSEIEKLCNAAKPYFNGMRKDFDHLPILIDIFAIGYEMDLVEIRIKESYDLFDYYVVWESAFGDRLIRKPLFFEQNYHKRYKAIDTQNKIIRIIQDDTQHFDNYVKNKYTKQFGDSWVNEGTFRVKGWQHLLKIFGLKTKEDVIKHFNRSLDDIYVYISDLDEIPTYESVARFKYCQPNDEMIKLKQHARIKNSEHSNAVHYYRNNFDHMWKYGGTPSSIYTARPLLDDPDHSQSLSIQTVGSESVPLLELVNINRGVNAFQLTVKNLLIAEQGKIHPHREFLDANKPWPGQKEFMSKYNYVNDDKSYHKFIKDVVSDPAIQSNWIPHAMFTRFGPETNSAQNKLRTGEQDKLLWFAACNKQRFGYLFPKYCKLVDKDNYPMKYQCIPESAQDKCKYKNY